MMLMFTIITVKASQCESDATLHQILAAARFLATASLFSLRLIAFGSSVESCPCAGHCKMS